MNMKDGGGLRRLRGSVRVWACLAALAAVSALVVQYRADSDSESSGSESNDGIPQTSDSLAHSAYRSLRTLASSFSDTVIRTETNQYDYDQQFYHHKDRYHAQHDHRDPQHQQSYHAHSTHPVYNEAHPALYPLSSSDYIGFSLATLGLMIAAGGGIGGGGILVPIYILVFGFSPKHAIPLSNVTVLGGAIANTLLNARKRHPLADRPMVDWDLILVMEPLTIAGALLGAFCNKILPETFLVVMLVILLGFTAHKSLTKAVKMYRAESAHLRQQGLRNDGTKESELTKISQNEDDGDGSEAEDELLKNMELQETEDNPVSNGSHIVLDDAQAKELDLILEEERRVPVVNIVILVVMFSVIIVVNLLKGGGAFPSPLGITCGSTAFWLSNAFMIGWIILVSGSCRWILINKFKRKQRCNYPYVEGDIKWDERATIVYPAICCLAGFFAGMFGIGGGIVKGPLMLAMGVHPAVSSASSACMILFTSFTASTSFVVFGLLIPDYATVCFTIGFIATFFGQIGLGYLMRRAKRNSYIAFSIGAVVLLSAILMTVQSILGMAEGEHHSSGGICGHDD